MEFPEEYIERRGNDEKPFTLHAGSESRVLYDVNAMLTDGRWVDDILNFVNLSGERPYVGIPTGGLTIAALASERFGYSYSLIKDSRFKGNVPISVFTLIDDVVTTETSLSGALEVLYGLGIDNNARIIAVVDRRPKERRRLNISSMFDVGE